MCIIAVKFKGSDFPPLDAIRNCAENNPDGFSMAWNEDGALKTYRTMDKAEAIARYYTLSANLDPAKTALVFHARIATHGSKKISNCHCWTYGDKIAFAHNGILRSIPNRDDMTDSETFFRDIFTPALEGVSPEYALNLAEIICRDSHSRMAFLGRNGNVVLAGDWVKEQFKDCKGKIYFSNGTYRPRFQYPFGAASSVASLSSGRSRPAAKPPVRSTRPEVREQVTRYPEYYADIFRQTPDELP